MTENYAISRSALDRLRMITEQVLTEADQNFILKSHPAIQYLARALAHVSGEMDKQK